MFEGIDEVFGIFDHKANAQDNKQQTQLNDFDYNIQSPLSYPAEGPSINEEINGIISFEDVMSNYEQYIDAEAHSLLSKKKNCNRFKVAPKVFKPFVSLESCETVIHQIQATLHLQHLRKSK
ncbi:hypothetical protein GPJ56_003071 [Histomonas meleagridis]|uniref:uncharacterized protein n=1 Tax=Histomonas meleagridis TaxID=135588 RepID=UPI003559AFE8|nr:hypothetical protein GPJ56_003071 [Histomonas meleagridis]KAH0805155.1 hypothetical protein GO595_002100 [Histomonas meleagridis]